LVLLCGFRYYGQLGNLGISVCQTPEARMTLRDVSPLEDPMSALERSLIQEFLAQHGVAAMPMVSSLKAKKPRCS
jgi:hypothetical protein